MFFQYSFCSIQVLLWYDPWWDAVIWFSKLLVLSLFPVKGPHVKCTTCIHSISNHNAFLQVAQCSTCFINYFSRYSPKVFQIVAAKSCHWHTDLILWVGSSHSKLFHQITLLYNCPERNLRTGLSTVNLKMSSILINQNICYGQFIISTYKKG